jgi:hypothetical protein
MKRTWITPELIVLVRSNPEEAVLTACKTSTTTGSNATVINCGTRGLHDLNLCDEDYCSMNATS